MTEKELITIGGNVFKLRKDGPHPISLLPFVKDDSVKGHGRDFWAVKSTGNVCVDAVLGEILAVDAIAYCRRRAQQGESPEQLLVHVARQMVERGEWSGVESAFFRAIGAAVREGFEGERG